MELIHTRTILYYTRSNTLQEEEEEEEEERAKKAFQGVYRPSLGLGGA